MTPAEQFRIEIAREFRVEQRKFWLMAKRSRNRKRRKKCMNKARAARRKIREIERMDIEDLMVIYVLEKL